MTIAVPPKSLKNRNLLTGIIDILIPVYMCSVFIFSFNTAENNVISKLLALILMFFLAVHVLASKKILLDKFFCLSSGFVLFCLLSCFWAWDFSIAFVKCKTMMQVFILAFLLYNYLAKEKNVKYFIFVLTLSTTFFSIYTVLYFGIDVYFSGLEEGERMGTEIANVNTVGMWGSIASTLHLWYVFYQKKLLNLIPLSICVIVTLGSGSRTAMAGLALGLFVILITSGNTKKRIKGMLIGAVLGIIFIAVLQLPIFESVWERFDLLFNTFLGKRTIGSADIRLKMIDAGLEQFVKTPIGGIGIGNSAVLTQKVFNWSTYLHNNYVELLSSVGLIGTMLYYSLLIVPLLWFSKKTRRTNSVVVLCIAIVFIELLFHYGTVGYSDKIEWMQIAFLFAVMRQIKSEEVTSSARDYMQNGGKFCYESNY